MTEEEKKEISDLIDQRITEFALKLPHVISNLVMESSAKLKMFNEFLQKNDYLRTVHAELVAKIIGDVESDNPGKPYDYILKEAEPIIRERLKILSDAGLDKKPTKPDNLILAPSDEMKVGDLGEI